MSLLEVLIVLQQCIGFVDFTVFLSVFPCLFIFPYVLIRLCTDSCQCCFNLAVSIRRL